MIKKLIISFCLIATSHAQSFSDDPVTSIEIKQALGRALLKIETMEDENQYFNRRIDNLEKDIKKLQKQRPVLKDIYETKSKPISLSISSDTHKLAVTKAIYTNIRELPTRKSRVISTLPMCSKVAIKECKVNGSDGVWCKLKGYGYINKKILSFKKARLSIARNFNLRSRPEINPNNIVTNTIEKGTIEVFGISQNKIWACVEDDLFISANAIENKSYFR